jgi:hypothetical protein
MEALIEMEHAGCLAAAKLKRASVRLAIPAPVRMRSAAARILGDPTSET